MTSMVPMYRMLTWTRPDPSGKAQTRYYYLPRAGPLQEVHIFTWDKCNGEDPHQSKNDAYNRVLVSKVR